MRLLYNCLRVPRFLGAIMSTPHLNQLHNEVISLKNGATFSGPEIHKKFPKLSYKQVYGKLQFMTKQGILEKVNTWNGENNVIYRVVDDSKKPRTIDLSTYYAQKKQRTASALYAGVSQKIATPKTVSTPETIVKAINQVALQLEEILKLSQSLQPASITSFSNEELFMELNRRTTPSS